MACVDCGFPRLNPSFFLQVATANLAWASVAIHQVQVRELKITRRSLISHGVTPR